MSERPEGAETVGIRRKRGKKGDIIAGGASITSCKESMHFEHID